LADINGDGKIDIVGINGSDIIASISLGDGKFLAPISLTKEISGTNNFNYYPRELADINGDGKADIISFDQSLIITCLNNNGLDSFSENFNFLDGKKLSSNNFGSENTYKKFMLDTNKDGKEDMVYVYSGSDGAYTYTALSNGDGTFANLVGGKISVLGGFGGLDSYKKMFTDLNGDGNKDIIFVWDDNWNHQYIYSSLSNGNGTFGEVKVGIESKLTFNSNLYEKILLDANNDGKEDLAYIYSGSEGVYLNVAFSNGDGTFTNDFDRKISDNSNFGNYNSYQKIISDLNGDGLKDIVLAYSGTDGATIYSSLNSKLEDRISGDAGNDMLTGSSGNDRIEGGEGNDIIKGGRGNDTLNGDNGSDVIYDEDGNDVINGGTGNDVIYAGKGADIISGNQGNDIFSFESLLSSTAQEIDTIVDFNNQEDLIDISNVGIKSFDSLEITNNGIDTIIDDKNSNFIFKLSGIHLLTQDDFII
jgi:Ca2+-binding RTX toxin-like protein